MAENENKSDKKFELTSSVSGMNTDNTLNQVEKGKVTYALNASVENFSGTSINYQNEQGNSFCMDFPEGYSLIGKKYVPERTLHIFMLVNPLTGNSMIGTMLENSCEFVPLTNSSCLGFSIDDPIHKILHRIQDGQLEIYWADNIARRYLNIDNIPTKLSQGSPQCSPVYGPELDCNRIKVQPMFDIPILSVEKTSEGGTLKEGVYQFAAQYSDALGNGYTSYYSVTNPIPIADPLRISVNFDNVVNKSIHLNIENLDTTGVFQHINIAVIKTINNITSVELVGTYYIDNEVKNIIYTGQQVDSIRLSIDDIFKRFPFYDKAEDLTVVQDVIVWDQLSTSDRVNYQKIANKISLDWVTYRLPESDRGYLNESNASNFVSYLRDESYPFEIVFVTGEGKESDGFHIPGRELTELELQLGNVGPDNPDYTFDGEEVPYWKVYNTAFFKGLHPSYSSDPSYKGPYMYGGFGYHESTEEYPCDAEIWGELAGKKIRHHRFPDNTLAPIFESKPFTSVSEMEMGNNAIFSLGVKIDPNQIAFLIETSDLTRDQKDNVVGYKILRGDRTTNKSVIAKGILRNVGKYEREGQEYYFPNYPYNDLSPDPFLNSTNNAFSAVCEPFDINIGTAGNVEIEYTDCSTNKQIRATFPGPGFFNICSTTKPVVITGIATISYSNYEIWRVRSESLQGVRVEWEDIVEGIKNRWVSGGLHNLNPGGAPVFINVKSNTVPQIIGGANNFSLFRYSYVFSDAGCPPPTSLDSYKQDAYRQIFNSPETSFGTPSLGNVLKLESVIFGKGKAHFTEVKDNAKYKLISREAQLDMLKSSSELGSITDPFDPSAFFAAFQAYTTTYLNGMTRRNFAYSFNSIASYDYYRIIPNDEGIKQRKLDISRYLIPGVQNVGDDLNINNYQRETSIFLKTDVDQPDLPFPDSSNNMLAAGVPMITDQSRFSVSGKGKCGNPGKEEDISVVSYYASIKNNVPNQWGQIYSYETVDTGFYNPVDGTNDIIFGGDTFIGKFAFKTKLPFFIDNRVGAPDDSDIFYDEIGNVAYPKYWHSSRSILENYSVPDVGVLSNVLSYKAHNFDCPNSQGEENETDASGRTFYDGIFYLFAYGIPYFYCESSYNIDLRQAFNNKEGDFFPRVSTGIPDDWLQEKNVSIANDNTYTYNQSFSKQNREFFVSHLPFDWNERLFEREYPFRAIFSERRSIDSDNRVNNWLIYKPLSYFDFPQNFGKITSLEGINDKQVLVRFENRSQVYNALVTTDVSIGQMFLGQSIFSSEIPPIDFGESDLGYMGSQHLFFLKTPYGYINVDAKRSQIFILSGMKAMDISGSTYGNKRFFEENLPFIIHRYFPEVNIDNNFKDIGLHGVFDKRFDRFILTKLDYEPVPGVEYDNETKEFYVINLYGGQIPIREVVSVRDSRYFCNKSWTISFNFKIMAWVSFHSYLPNWYINEPDKFYSGLNECCDEFDVIAVEAIPDPNATTTTSTTLITTSTTTTKSPGIATTTTTTTAIDCSFDVFITEYECFVGEITGYILVDSVALPCQRPEGVMDFMFYAGYTLDGDPEVDSTVSLETACAAIAFLLTIDQYSEIEINALQIQTLLLTTGQNVYLKNDTIDCETIPDGYYFTDESLDTKNIYYVVDGVIVAVMSCYDILTINWEVYEGTGLGSDDYVDANMRIFVNEVMVVESFSNESGSINVIKDSTIRVQYFHLGATFELGVGVVDPLLQLLIDGEIEDSINLAPDIDVTENYSFTLLNDRTVFVRGVDAVSLTTTTTTTVVCDCVEATIIVGETDVFNGGLTVNYTTCDMGSASVVYGVPGEITLCIKVGEPITFYVLIDDEETAPIDSSIDVTLNNCCP